MRARSALLPTSSRVVPLGTPVTAYHYDLLHPLLTIVRDDADKEKVFPKRRVFGDEERDIASQSVAFHHRNGERMSVPQFLSTVICLVALVWPGLSAASYLIQLRNGRQIATSQYWKEGQTIKFNTAGGIGGVPESAVLRIQTVEDTAESDLVGAAERQIAPQAERQIAPRAEVQRDGGKTSKLDLEAYRQKKEAIKSQLDMAVERYRDASSAHDPEEKSKIQREITSWSKQLFDLRDEVEQKNQGRLPEGWETF